MTNKHPYRIYQFVPDVGGEFKPRTVDEMTKDLDEHLKLVSKRNREWLIKLGVVKK